jgi:hypothetical protein
MTFASLPSFAMLPPSLIRSLDGGWNEAAHHHTTGFGDKGRPFAPQEDALRLGHEER